LPPAAAAAVSVTVTVTMPTPDLQGRKVFKVFNQEFIVDERYNVTKELGQGAYGIVWYASLSSFPPPKMLS
jgi:hypothetical protein